MIRLFERLVIKKETMNTVRRSIFTNTPLSFQVTQILCAEPLKKKKKLDPAILRAREEKKKRKLEKQIRRLEKNARQLKPLDECEVPETLYKPEDMKIRTRQVAPMSESEVDSRVRLMKDWARHRQRQALEDLKMIDRLAYSQARALDKLRQESEELYQEAIQIDPGFLPFKVKGPVVTPPIENYDSPDGEYVDVSKKW
ncbi:39S ribosomal protein L40, mitochondrial [Macrosteles quadrilineatus]|uniref:39S ribosomal protein L40, mitochondrial n=1 Tax=Macrosteles quadrilineatus TaxID=74068 RepID=UPI0023E0D6B5|nr:39S ribosomal protein L40, mitochondrial [Macrosteles quadrilineatus]